MSNYSPIPSPPPELVEQWRMDYIGRGHAFIDVAAEIARWAADQELEACAEWVGSMFHGHKTWADELCASRRAKPPSLKEQALEALERMDQFPTIEDKIAIRLALEALPND